MKRLKYVFFILCFGLFAFTFGSCKTGEGCDVSEYQVPVDKDGNLSTKRGKSNLYSKKQRKRMKSRN